MNREMLTTAMKASISEVLETMFYMAVDFVAADAGEGDAGEGCDGFSARLEFKGPLEGFFHLRVPEMLAGEIAADFLGIDPNAVTPEDVSETVKEMVNMLAGNTLSLYDPELVFDLGVPERMDWRRACAAEAGDLDRVSLNVQTLSNHLQFTAFFQP